MKTRPVQNGVHALTMVEVLIVIAVLLLVVESFCLNF